MTARDELDRALLHLAERGQRPPCAQRWAGDLWVSDDHGERREAARLCSGCPVLEQCAAAADENDERHHVWAGVDRTGLAKGVRRGHVVD